MTFFQKVHFIQKCSVTQNTVFQNVKNNFLLSQNKLVFFTILNLLISHNHHISTMKPGPRRHSIAVGFSSATGSNSSSKNFVSKFCFASIHNFHDLKLSEVEAGERVWPTASIISQNHSPQEDDKLILLMFMFQ